ncbi:MAG TPA: hypothetical protein VET88_11380 [Gammaproteobacteria bacterium]|nr:hypothetical protein [Gammaproteobacteria bacterium]
MRLRITNIAQRFKRLVFGDIANLCEANIVLTAGLHIQRIRQLGTVESLGEAEFRAFSQWGEDGIIQYLINKVPIHERSFVEFGVENYTESNTRFLLLHDNWKGLVIDGSHSHVDFIKRDSISWKHDLTAVCRFITRENINEILAGSGFSGDIGLLSIDIDGNDYWVWEKIDVIRPRIVICEYNSVFGCEHAVTVPYDAEFERGKAHYCNLYHGASLAALCRLATGKGYDFVGSNSTGTNAFFVRNDLQHGLRTFTATEGYIESKIRESRNEAGKLTFLTGEDRLRAMQDMPVYRVDSNTTVAIRELM